MTRKRHYGPLEPLKPCPFCGMNNARVQHSDQTQYCWVQCTCCGARIDGTSTATKPLPQAWNIVIKRWNLRTEPETEQ